MTGSQRDLYTEYMALLVSEAERVLKRALTASERQALWNVGSLLRLERLTDDLELLTRSSSDVEAWISRIVQQYVGPSEFAIRRFDGPKGESEATYNGPNPSPSTSSGATMSLTW